MFWSNKVMNFFTVKNVGKPIKRKESDAGEKGADLEIRFFYDKFWGLDDNSKSFICLFFC